VQLQEQLEQACYIYGQKEMQDILRERGWDCAEAVELDSWMEEFSHRHKTFNTDKNSETLKELFQSVADIRHTAVRRSRIDSAKLKKFLLDAEGLMRVLKVEEYVGVVESLRLDVERVLIVLSQNASFVQVKAEKIFSEIAAEREQLDRRENAAKVSIYNGVESCQALAGSEVMEAIRKAERTTKPEIGRWN